MLTATAMLRGEIIDRRRLCLEARYSFLSYSEFLRLANTFLAFTSDLLSREFYTQWAFCGKSLDLSALKKVLFDEPHQSYGLDFYAEADIQSCHVYNKASFRHFCRENERILTLTDKCKLYAEDYPSSFQEAFSPDIAKNCKGTLLQWFAQRGKVNLGTYYDHDAYAYFSGCSYHGDHSNYHGILKLYCSVACLGTELSIFSEKLLCFAKELAADYQTVNALISLTPLPITMDCSPYMLYFGKPPKEPVICKGIQYSPIEWYQFAYLCGAEWANVLSPKTLQFIFQESLTKTDLNAVSIELLGNGGAAVVLKKDIAATDVNDLATVKRLLYPALLPGGRSIKKKNFFDLTTFCSPEKPRLRWESIPVFEYEIIETEDTIVYRHSIGDGLHMPK